MTDLERAAWAALKGDITSWPAQIVAALAEARQDGAAAEAEEMRGCAYFLLFAVDAYVTTNRDGRVTEARNGLSLEGLATNPRSLV